MTPRTVCRRFLALGLCAAACGARPATAPGPGKPNRLIHESSPYLLLHADNPVDWYPWGDEAIDRARREDKPIFLSIGYSTCYWCHVMEREVFSDPAIAALMNRWFVSVEVDREERPDLDELYLTATELLTGDAGWPSSLFLTPDLEPFYAGTYFPPEDRAGRPGFPTVLGQIHQAWTERRPEVLSHAHELAFRLKAAMAERSRPAAEVPGRKAADRVVQALEAEYDPEHSGFGGAPKFPSPATLFLLWERARSGDADAGKLVLATLRAMGAGAIDDQVGGGFHRYTLDAAWRVPHFEKMLYDNASLAELLAATAAAGHDPELERLARATFDFVLAKMTTPEGAFKSAIDAETGGVEGAYYLWTRPELEAALGKEGVAFLTPIYGLDEPPNFPDGRRTLYLTHPLSEQAARLGISRTELLARLQPRLDALRAARERRPAPAVDDKALTDWNGLMIAALARGGETLGEPRYVAAATRAADFLLAHARDEGGHLLHAWRQGKARIPAFLDDYAFLIRGLLALDAVAAKSPAARAAGDPGRFLAAAERLAGELETRLGDPAGGWFLSAPRPHLLFRAKTATDGALPSGNGIAILDLLELAARTGRPAWRERATAALRAFAGDVEELPQAMPTVARAIDLYAAAALSGEARGGPPAIE